MKYSYILFSTLLVSQSALSQNEVNITLQNGKIDNFQTANLNSIEFNQDQITVNPINGNTITYDGNVSQIKFKKIAEGNITISEAKGWLESAYAEWAIMKGAESYNVYIKVETSTNINKLTMNLYVNIPIMFELMWLDFKQEIINYASYLLSMVKK